MSMPPTDQAQQMETRCSVAVFRDEHVLVVRSVENGPPVWKLPGGHVHPDEGLVACARRELREETGLVLDALHCAFVLDVHDRLTGRYMVEIILIPDEEVTGEPVECERGREPQFVRVEDLAGMNLNPPIQTVLHSLRSLHQEKSTEGVPPDPESYMAGIGQLHLAPRGTTASVADADADD
ncbi:NUDIX domain-containing protein [Streptomyces sp. SID4923]|nr:NUDIX domain-containing protein [Streptomyces sp. SID4923]